MARELRFHLLSCAALLAIAPVQAHAQSASVAKDTDKAKTKPAATSDIVVTGTRIKQDGYSAPTPVTVLSTAEINAYKPTKITDVVYTLPAVTPIFTAKTLSGNLSAGNAGIDTVSLRGFSPNRTLVLLNGQRTVPSTFDGLVDIGTFPQDLIKRVDVVTGGASAQYGSDAISGVVNFILDDGFKGFRVGGDTSITTHGDGQTYRFSATAGLSLLDDRLHVVLNGEYSHQDPINTVDRSWNNSGYELINNPAYVVTNGVGNGQPRFLVGSGIGPSARTRGGLIQSGPLKGTYFLGDGVTGQLNYGTVSGPWMIGGDWRITSDGGVGTASLLPDENRYGLFSRVAYDINPDVTIFGQVSWSHWDGRQHGGAFPETATIKADNGFLLTQYPLVAAAMQANALNSVSVGYWTSYPNGSDNSRDVYRYTVGGKGKFSFFNRPWSWDFEVHHGANKAHEQTTNSPNTARLLLATDAVLSNGQVVCRSTLTDPTNGCVPLDVLGTSGPSAAAIAYIMGPEQPWRNEIFKLDDAQFNVGGQILDLPGGPMSVALGGEWRKESADGKVGLTSSSGWRGGGNYKVNRGSRHVGEAYIEASLPLFKGFNLDAAGRYTNYSTSGGVGTWKVGATYSPVSDIKFRGSYSRDIRAPNLSELYLNASTTIQPVVLPPNSPSPGPVIATTVTSGNPSLKVEKGKTWTVGVVAQPRFLRGVSASVDYWDINLKDAIGTVTFQQTIDFCYGGVTQFCDNLVFANGQLQQILLRPTNFSKQHAKGIDFEASYHTPLSAISPGLPGTFSIHGTATYYLKDLVDNLVVPVDLAGVNSSPGRGVTFGMPKWYYRVNATYEADPVTLNFGAHGFSPGVYSNEYIQCTSGCPTATLQHPTINNNHIAGTIYFDGSVAVKIHGIGNETNLTFVVNNIFNKDPVLAGLDPSGAFFPYRQASAIYDTIGRTFRIALSSKF